MSQTVRLAWFAACLLSSGCAQIKSGLRETLDDVVGIEPDEQRQIVEETKKVALAPQRHGGTGLYVAGGANPDYHAGAVEIGVAQNEYWAEVKGGLALHLSGAANHYFVGPTGSLRFHLPTRVSPFAGLGAFAGYSESSVLADRDGIDNNDDGFTDEWGERRKDFDGAFASIFPEVGVHCWLTNNLRLTVSASYHVTTEGRRHDFWMIGGGVGFFTKR